MKIIQESIVKGTKRKYNFHSMTASAKSIHEEKKAFHKATERKMSR